MHVDAGNCRTASIDDQLVLGRGLGGDLGGVAEPTLLHGEGEIGHCIDVTHHVNLISRGRLKVSIRSTDNAITTTITIAESVRFSKRVERFSSSETS